MSECVRCGSPAEPDGAKYCEGCQSLLSRKLAESSRSRAGRYRMDWKCESCGLAHSMPRIACSKCGCFSPRNVQSRRDQMFKEYEALEIREDPFAKSAEAEAPAEEPLGQTRGKSYWMCWSCGAELSGQSSCRKCGSAATFILGRDDGSKG